MWHADHAFFFWGSSVFRLCISALAPSVGNSPLQCIWFRSCGTHKPYQQACHTHRSISFFHTKCTSVDENFPSHKCYWNHNQCASSHPLCHDTHVWVHSKTSRIEVLQCQSGQPWRSRPVHGPMPGRLAPGQTGDHPLRSAGQGRHIHEHSCSVSPTVGGKTKTWPH